MSKNTISNRLYDAIDFYYHYNPDTLMPLLMVALATRRQLSVSTCAESSDTRLCSLVPAEIKDYEWVKLDSNLERRVAKWIKDEVKCVSIDMEIGRSLLGIYETFKRNDEVEVVQEHHHRMGLLVHHSESEMSDKARSVYATFLLAEALISTSKENLRDNYFDLFNEVLECSGLQPRRPRIKVAEALSTLLQYEGDGVIYNPFAGCSIVGAMLGSANNYYGDGSKNDKEYAAGLLLNYGMGISNEHFIQRDSREWLKNKKIDYLVSTYTGYIDGVSTFDFCLGKCLEDITFKGKYAGIAPPRELFEKQTSNFKEALERDWIETIVLLPFGEAAVLVNADKAEQAKGLIRVVDGLGSLARFTSIEQLVSEDKYAQIVTTDNAQKNGFLKSLFVKELPERSGYQKVRLGELVSRIPRKVYHLDNVKGPKVLAYINRSTPYYGIKKNEGIEKRPIRTLLDPAYLLKDTCLIVNASGDAEPRIFTASRALAYFKDGFAFACDDSKTLNWIAYEMRETYVRDQLHPYGQNEMVPERLTEQDYLNLTFYAPKNKHDQERANALPDGFILHDANKQYTILDFIAPGQFSYTYRAEMLDCATGEKEIVAIKEFFPKGDQYKCTRDGCRVIYPESFHKPFNEAMDMFEKEPAFIRSLNDIPDNHVTEVKSTFRYQPTGTSYYVMKYYSGQTLYDMVVAHRVPSSEELIIEKIVIPLCKALHAMHTHRILHLDIRPNNVVIDENDEAVLIDFGVAQQYDTSGNNLIERGDIHLYEEFSAPENDGGGMKHFSPPSDIFGAAATLYYLLSGELPMPVSYNNKFMLLDDLKCSEQMANAILEGMAKYSTDRPSNAQAFLNLFPGCEDIKL